MTHSRSRFPLIEAGRVGLQGAVRRIAIGAALGTVFYAAYKLFGDTDAAKAGTDTAREVLDGSTEGSLDRRTLAKSVFGFSEGTGVAFGFRRYPDPWKPDLKAARTFLRAMAGVWDSKALLTRSRRVDFASESYVLQGGPIPNPYVRNLMYDAEFPGVRFRLDLHDALARATPLELRDSTVARDNQLRWPLVRRDGATFSAASVYPRGEHISGEPAYNTAGELETDAFTVLRMRGWHADEARVTVFAGCHAAGTLAASALLENGLALQAIRRRVGDHDFQLIGNVAVHEGKPDADTIRFALERLP